MIGQKDSSIRRNLNRIDDMTIAALWEAKPFLLESADDAGGDRSNLWATRSARKGIQGGAHR
jgi:hypothetical protein